MYSPDDTLIVRNIYTVYRFSECLFVKRDQGFSLQVLPTMFLLLSSSTSIMLHNI